MGTNGNSTNDKIDPGGMDYLGRAIGSRLGFGPSDKPSYASAKRATTDPNLYNASELSQLGITGGKDNWTYAPGAVYRNPDRAEWARQVAIKLGTNKVNSIYDDPARAKNQQDFLAAMRAFYTEDANRQKGVADRNRRFSMARSGLSGGSADTDSNRLLGEEYTRGLLDSERKAQGAYSDLVGRDEASRNDLLAAVRAGMDVNTAASRSAAAMRDNAAAAQSAATVSGLGDIFGSTASLYKSQQDAAARRRGAVDAYGSLYGAKSPYG